MRLVLALLLVPSAAFAERYAVITQTTALHTSTTADGVIVRASSQRVMRVVQSGPEWTELVSDATHQCYDAPDASGLALHLFAKTTELADVTTGEVAVPFDDGTSVSLLQGVAVGPEARGDREILDDEFRVAIPLPPAALGKIYADPPQVHAQRGGYSAPDDIGLTLDHRHRVLHVLDVAWPLYVDNVEDRPDGSHRITLDGRCTRFRLDYRGTLYNGDPGFNGGYGHGGYLPSYDTIAGTTVYWLNGEVAGTVRVTETVDQPAPSSRADRTCLLAPFDGLDSAPIAVCFATRDLRVRRR